MANEIKGEFTLEFTSEGEKQTFRLYLDVNALCEAEGVLGMSSAEIVNKIGSGDMRLLRTLLWCASREHHNELTIDDCGDLITEASPNTVAATLLLGLQRTFPAPKGGDARPTRARRGKATATA